MKLTLGFSILIIAISIVSCNTTQKAHSSKNTFNSKIFAKNKSSKIFAKNNNYLIKENKNPSRKYSINQTFSFNSILTEKPFQIKEIVLDSIPFNNVATIKTDSAIHDQFSVQSETIVLLRKPPHQYNDSLDRNVITTQDDPNDEKQPPKKKVEGLGIAGMILGIISLVYPLLPLGILALIFGIFSLIRIRKNSETFKGRGFGIAAIILGSISIVVMILMILFLFSLIARYI